MRASLLDYQGLGRGVAEISHRSAPFEAIQREAEANLRALLDIPDDYAVLFLHGGARMQFPMIPMNFLWSNGGVGDYIVTGHWGKAAITEVDRFGVARLAYDGAKTGYRAVPSQGELKLTSNARYVHYTSNETIEGVEFQRVPDTGSVPLICDASSNILSRPLDVRRHGIIYAGAQKNLGIAGVTVVIIKRSLLDRMDPDVPQMLSYRAQVKADSRLNTPSVMAIYSVALTTRWIRETFGVLTEVEAFNRKKAALVYQAIDDSDGFYRGHAEGGARSRMNVAFMTPSPSLDELFVAEAEDSGLVALKGHRSLGGLRASLYNALPLGAAEALVGFMADFQKRYA